MFLMDSLQQLSEAVRRRGRLPVSPVDCRTQGSMFLMDSLQQLSEAVRRRGRLPVSHVDCRTQGSMFLMDFLQPLQLQWREARKLLCCYIGSGDKKLPGTDSYVLSNVRAVTTVEGAARG